MKSSAEAEPSALRMRPWMVVPWRLARYTVAAWLTFGTLVMWGLAEYPTGRLKLVAPSIVVVVFMTVLPAAATINWAIYLSGMQTHNDFPLYGALVA